MINRKIQKIATFKNFFTMMAVIVTIVTPKVRNSLRLKYRFVGHFNKNRIIVTTVSSNDSFAILMHM